MTNNLFNFLGKLTKQHQSNARYKYEVKCPVLCWKLFVSGSDDYMDPDPDIAPYPGFTIYVTNNPDQYLVEIRMRNSDSFSVISAFRRNWIRIHNTDIFSVISAIRRN